MAGKSEYDKIWTAMILITVFVLVCHLYYYIHPLLASVGFTNAIADGFIMKLRAGGMFSSPYKTKGMIALVIGMTMMTRGGMTTEKNWTEIVTYGVIGALLYLANPSDYVFYLLSTLGGLAFLIVFFGHASRKFSSAAAAVTDRKESFMQVRKKINTPDSINIRTVFQYRQRNRRGWINVVSPFRASLVLGTPGAGKSYSVYGPFIEQMIAKGYSMFLYDYKYPDLTKIVWNELNLNTGGFKVKPEFCVINFNDPRLSLRCNPLDPSYLQDPADATEIADLVMLNINKNAIEKEDFFSMSAKVYLDAIIWFLRIYQNGRYCTFPHVIELMSQDYRKVFAILARYPELAAKIKPFANALEGNAQDQLQGQIASAQIPLGKFISKRLYWVLTGNDFSLNINDPEHPIILCVANDPDRQTIYGTTLALLTSRMFKSINKQGRLKCGVLLDELPTIYLKGLDNLIATARSNKVAIVLGCQDKSQLRRDYGDKDSEVIFNTVGNVFCGQVNGKTAEDMSRSFGKIFRKRQSETQSLDSDSVNTSYQLEDVLPISTIETLSRGTFFGKVADGNGETIDEKFFYGEIQRDERKLSKKREQWTPIPQMTEFGDADIEQVMQENFEKIQQDVREIIESEFAKTQDVEDEIQLEYEVDPFE